MDRICGLLKNFSSKDKKESEILSEFEGICGESNTSHFFSLNFIFQLPVYCHNVYQTPR